MATIFILCKPYDLGLYFIILAIAIALYILGGAPHPHTAPAHQPIAPCTASGHHLAAPLQPLSEYLSSKLVTHPINISIADCMHSYLIMTMLETQVVWLPVYLCPLHCPANAPAPSCLAVAA